MVVVRQTTTTYIEDVVQLRHIFLILYIHVVPVLRKVVPEPSMVVLIIACYMYLHDKGLWVIEMVASIRSQPAQLCNFADLYSHIPNNSTGIGRGNSIGWTITKM